MPRLLALVLLTLPATLLAADRWTEFRGPNGSGISDAKNLPAEWSESKNVKWKTPVEGKAWSSPVVLDGQVWMANAPEDGKWQSAVCLDLETGAVLHDVVLFRNENPRFVIDMNSYASCTPVVEKGRVYVHFGRYGTACLDTNTAKVLWQRRDILVNHHRGPASSPVLFEDLLILTFDGFDEQFLVALDKETGKTVWKTDRNIDYGTDNGDRKKAYSTPAVFEVGGEPLLVSSSAGATIAYEPRTGKEVWRVNHGGMNAATRPVHADGKVIVNTAAGGFGLLAIDLEGTGDVTDTNVAWKTRRGVGTRPSPIVVDGLLYQVSDKGAASCLDPQTGETVWQGRLGGNFSSSPVYGDGKIYVFDESGAGYVVKPGREFELLAKNTLDAGCMATPAIVDDSLVVRTRTHVYRIAE